MRSTVASMFFRAVSKSIRRELGRSISAMQAEPWQHSSRNAVLYLVQSPTLEVNWRQLRKSDPGFTWGREQAQAALYRSGTRKRFVGDSRNLTASATPGN